MPEELSVIQKTYDLVLWFVPILNRFPRDHRFNLGDQMITHMYELLEGMVAARFAKDKGPRLEAMNAKLELVRYQVRLCVDFKLFDRKHFEFASRGNMMRIQ